MPKLPRLLILPLVCAAFLPARFQSAATQSAPYNGPRSGTLECTGSPIPQNAEYIFRDLPPVHLEFHYNQKIWDAKLVPGGAQTQTLILKNVGKGPQKKCLVHWTVVP